MGANNDVNVRNLGCQLLVHCVTRVTNGHDYVDSLCFELLDLPGDSFNLILKNKARRDVGCPDGLEGEVANETNLSSSFVNDQRILSQTIKLRYIPEDDNTCEKVKLMTYVVFMFETTMGTV